MDATSANPPRKSDLPQRRGQDRPLPDRLVSGRDRLPAAHQGVLRFRRQRHGRFRRSHRPARLHRQPRRDGDLAAALLPLAAARRRLRHRRLPLGQSGLRHHAGFPAFRRRGAQARHPRHHRAGHQPHLGPASLVPAGAPRQAGLGRPRLLRLERHRQALQRHAHHLHRHREIELDVGPGRPMPFSGTASIPTSPTSTSTIRASWRRSSASCISGSIPASTACVSTPSPISSSAKAPTTRTCRRPMRC